MLIAIDTSHQMTYTGMLSCKRADFKKFKHGFDEICRKAKINNKHWSKLTNREKSILAPFFVKLVNDSPLHFTVISHCRPSNKERKAYFLEEVAPLISKLIVTWFTKSSRITFVCDDDYNLRNMGTKDFVEKVFKKFAELMTGGIVALRRENNAIRMTIKNSNSQIFELYGFIAHLNSSEEIWVIDNFLGCYLFNKQNGRKVSWDKNKVYFKEI